MAAAQAATFADHIQELRSRLMKSLFFVAIGAGIGYALHNTLLSVLQKPLHEKLYYTTPTGAFSFIIKVCTVFGIVVALPALLYHGFAFFQPLISSKTKRSITLYVFLSVILACLGIAFAYFISLPAALNFLVNFGNDSGTIESLITTNEYFNFVLAYIAGFAVLFQLPLIISFINRIKPLTPKKLFGATRYVVLASFIIAAVITPTPDPFNQLLMAGPVILLYFASACVVAVMNAHSRRVDKKRSSRPPDVDIDSVIESLLNDQEPAPVPIPVPTLQPQPEPVPVSLPPEPLQAQTMPSPATPAMRPRRLVNDMVVPARRPASPAYQQRTARPITAPAKPAARPTPQMGMGGMISDFIPATE